MADVRALLRQQRAARRITHPYATYSDAGKLLCALCRDQIRAEAHWDAHLASDKHKKRLSATSGTANANGKDDYRQSDEVIDQEQDEGTDDAVEGRDQRAETPSATHKRKLDHVAATAADEHDTDKDMDDEAEDEEEDEVRRKRSRHASPENGRKKPQGLSQGVQVQIPSRSTTPADSLHSGSSVAKTTTTTTKLATSLPSRQASNLATPASSSSMSIQQQEPEQQQEQRPQPPASASQNQQVDEDEWAAFEADIAAESAPYDADAVIARPAMTAEEAAAAKEAAAAEQEEALQNPASRKTRADAELEDEREEATRALEEEFEEMQELEARVQRLKEKREALMRKRGETIGQDQADDVAASLQAAAKPSSDAQKEGKENLVTTADTNEAEAENDDEDDEDGDDDDDEDDWDGFRFRTGR
ncbi:hypothetical protein J3F83DRAFT_756115 [Trichoderma novae-zelandiae]